VGRRLGQHFLFQDAILERIARSACPERAPHVVEIGPGPGGLTNHLLPHCDQLTAIELDPPLAARLRENLNGNAGFRLIESDVLDVDLSQWGAVVVCGNLPYYITSPIIEKTLALGPLLMRAVFLVQKEVADRIAAKPGSRDYGYLSVMVQSQCAVEKLFVVKPSSFRPPPKVDSAVIRLTPRTDSLTGDLARFLRFASACFRLKRKTLRNNLRGSVSPDRLAELPEAGLRAEQLSVEDLVRIHKALS
jgi:16S rRNA (adenine1518-N6/adenine1519-N6)-dimethyltransferase